MRCSSGSSETPWAAADAKVVTSETGFCRGNDAWRPAHTPEPHKTGKGQVSEATAAIYWLV